ncbi:MAG: dihydrolipoyl dehydrogenase [Smithellaceae bacterium]
MSEKINLVVIGGGPGGLAAAEMAAAKHKKVLIIEKGGWGGTCTHRGCIPTKALLTCSKFYSDLKKLKRLGILMDQGTIDFAAMKKHQQQIVKVAALGAHKALADAGVETRQGTGEILSPREVKFTNPDGQSQLIKTDNVLLAWGSEPQILPGIQTSDRISTSDDILNIQTLPACMIIVGGSFIGVEYAVLFAELGVKVILVELLERILPLEDEDAADHLMKELARLGIAIHTGTRLISLKETENGVVMQAWKNGETLEMRTGLALLCTGRKPVLHKDQLDSLGIEYTPAGIQVDRKMQTTVRGLYAAGDVTGGMMLAHRAAAQARVAVQSMFGGSDYACDENVIPSVVYSHPQIARVGFTRARAEAAGLDVDVTVSAYSANIIARSELMGQGFAKAVFHRGIMIGATIVGEGAGELIAPLALAVSNELTKKQLRKWVIPHPTLSEIFLPLIQD